MDPLSIERKARASVEEQSFGERFSEIIVSCRSLSRYDAKSFKTLVPQIIASAIAASFHVVVGISLAYSAIMIPQLVEKQNICAALNDTHLFHGRSVDVSNDANLSAEVSWMKTLLNVTVVWTNISESTSCVDTIDRIKVTESEASWIASVIVIVNPVGTIVSGFIMDITGRLNMIKIAVVPMVIGWILIASATNVPMILAGRILTGWASAWGTGPAIVYITEIARTDMRGSLISIILTYVSLGMVITYLKGWFLEWRLVAWLSIIYSVVPFILLVFIPESPMWLVSRGKIEDAKKSLDRIHKYQPKSERQIETYAEMQLGLLQREQELKTEEQTKIAGNNAVKKLMMFFKPTGYKPLLILAGIFFFQQFSGIYITFFYAVTFFKDIGTDINPYLASVFIGVIRLVMSVANTWLMKKFPRRSLIMLSAAGMAVFMGISGMFTGWIHEGTTTQTWVPGIMLMLYMIMSMMGMLTIPWTMTAELFPLAIRGLAHSIAYSVAYLIMFASIQSYYSLKSLCGGSSGLQYFFAVVSLGGLLFNFVFLPETHKKKLSEIENYFNQHSTYFSVRKSNRNAGKQNLLTKDG